MKTKFNFIFYFSILLIILSALVGIIIPRLIFAQNILTFQFIFTSILTVLLIIIVLLYIEKKLSEISPILDNIMNNLFDIKIKTMDGNVPFKHIRFIYENLNHILHAFSNFISEQNHIMKKYSILNKQLKKNNLIRDAMLDVTNSLVKITESEELFHLILNKIINIVDSAETGSVLILKDDKNLQFKATVGFDNEKLKKINLTIEETFLWRASNGKIEKPCIIRDIRSFNNFNLKMHSYKSFEEADALNIEITLSSPIIIDGKLYGMINIDSTKDDAFNNEDMLLMEYFSKQISIAIKNHQLLEKTIMLSRYDGLTNAYNRCYFDELLDKAYEKALRYNETFCLVVFDLNKLKYINDNFGHVIGDKVLITFAQAMQDNIRNTDLFSRYGGDEFIGVFLNTDIMSIKERIEKIANRLKKFPLKVDNKDCPISFSYGISCFPEDSKVLHSLIQIADKRMYENKKRNAPKL